MERKQGCALRKLLLMDSHITDQIKQLELTLLHTDMQADPTLLDTLLAQEFKEIGSNGHVSARQEVVDWLLNKNPNDRWALTDFSVEELSSDLVLAIYHACKISKHNGVSNGSTRSSIWKHDGKCWKMVFHQASKRI
ncbi:MAG: DUF4440 domain-containing protein [Betaproteobacteria bacterium]|nr:DUF4440 domain-containing protein [Betaproteobacteria bacterium]